MITLKKAFRAQNQEDLKELILNRPISRLNVSKNLEPILEKYFFKSFNKILRKLN